MDNNKKILVTGGTGLIGNNLIPHLLKNEKPSRLVCLSNGGLIKKFQPFKDEITTVQGDINDYAFVDSIINHYQINYIYHLAAETQVDSSNKSPLRCLETNIIGTANILESAKQNHVKGIIAMSSDKYYGRAPDVPYLEDLKPDPTGVYEVSKTCSDQICRVYGKNFGVPVISIRGCNIFGPGDRNFSRIVPNSIRRMIQGQNPMLWSDVKDYIREFIYVKDAINILTKLMNVTDENSGESVNVGVGFVIGIEDFVSLMIKHFDGINEIDIIEKEQHFNEIKNQSLDLCRLKSMVGDSCVSNSKTMNDIDGCLGETVEYYKKIF